MVLAPRRACARTQIPAAEGRPAPSPLPTLFCKNVSLLHRKYVIKPKSNTTSVAECRNNRQTRTFTSPTAHRRSVQVGKGACSHHFLINSGIILLPILWAKFQGGICLEKPQI